MRAANDVGLDIFAFAADICGQHDSGILSSLQPPKPVRDAFGNVLNPRHCGCNNCEHGQQHVTLVVVS